MSGDVNGGNVQTYGYDEFGVHGTTSPARFGYTGQVYVPEAGLYYYKARMYSPGLGRFMQTDPIGYADGPNMYAYVGNNPVNAIDPWGLAKTKSCTGSRIRRPLGYDCNKMFSGTGPLTDTTPGFDATLTGNGHIGFSSGGRGGVRQKTLCVHMPEGSSCGLVGGFAPQWGRQTPFSILDRIENLIDPGPKTTPNPDYCGSKSSNSEALVPDRVGSKDLSSACRDHDQCYTTSTDRLTCDRQFRRDINLLCVRETGRGCPNLAGAYYAGVRIGGRFAYKGTGRNN